MAYPHCTAKKHRNETETAAVKSPFIAGTNYIDILFLPSPLMKRLLNRESF